MRPRAPSGRVDIVILGLSITSSWGNGHATTYRGLVKGLAAQGHRVTFLERDVPWYAENRDLPDPPHCRTFLYSSLSQLEECWSARVREADVVVVGSFVPDGIAVARWAQARARGRLAFYDIDTPVTLAALDSGACAYLDRRLISGFDVYFSFTGGPTLARLERDLGARRALPLYCAVDPEDYSPAPAADVPAWDLGYMGTYSADRQPMLDALLLEPARRTPARRFVQVGPLYPATLDYPKNVERFVHLAPAQHRAFYGAQRFTLNVTRAAMVRAGYSPSVRLFEAGACAVPVISDAWPGIEEVFEPGEEILLARNGDDVVRFLTTIDESEAYRIGQRARRRVLAEHTPEHRAQQLLAGVLEAATARGASVRA
jgi:spore maturation protein CgeB